MRSHTLLISAFATAIVLAAGLAGRASAEREAACFTALPAGTIAATEGGTTLTLDDGRAVRLADIVAAEALLAPGASSLPSEHAGGPLTGLAVIPQRAADTPPEGDRYGRIVGDAVRKDTGQSVLMQALQEGLALVDPAVMSDQCLDTLFAAERRAEAAQRGLWAREGVVRSADEPNISARAGSYVLVSGVVKSVGETRSNVYLNFGDEYRTDFTALVSRNRAKGWADGLKALAGQSVRLRGVLEAWHGGLIRLEHPRQIERRDVTPPT